jgi:hypothetical protein
MRIETVRRGAVALAAARAALGVTALAFPSVVARPWVGAAGDDLAGKVLGRALGARDLALGLGTLAALRTGPARGWMAAGALSDAFDVASSAASWPELPKVTRWLVAASAGGASVAGAIAVLALSDGPVDLKVDAVASDGA